MKIEIDTPVSYKYDSNSIRFGVVVAIEGRRAQVEWQVNACVANPRYNEEMKRKTWVAVERLTEWSKPVTAYPFPAFKQAESTCMVYFPTGEIGYASTWKRRKEALAMA